MNNFEKAISIFINYLILSAVSPVFAEQKTTLDCLIKPEMYIDVSSPVDGILESVLVKESDTITKGQVLAKLDASVELARVEVAEQESLMANRIYAKKLKLAYAARKVERISLLVKKNVSSIQERDDAATELALARTELAQIKLDKKKNELKLLLAQAELQQKTIVSPIEGIVVERYLMPGESVENKPILQIAKIDPLLVEVVASANLFGLIKPGMSVQLKSGFPVKNTYKATVSTVDRIIHAASGSFTIRLKLPNPGDKLVGGMKCTAIFPVKTPPRNNSSLNQVLDDDALPEDIKALLGE